MNEYNQSIATMLRTLADYVEMADKNVKLRLGIQFKLRNMGLVSIPVMNGPQFGVTLAAWSAQEVVATIKRYQAATGTTEGQELVDRFTEANRVLEGLTK
jgi:hypothetical protein